MWDVITNVINLQPTSLSLNGMTNLYTDIACKMINLCWPTSVHTVWLPSSAHLSLLTSAPPLNHQFPFFVIEWPIYGNDPYSLPINPWSQCIQWGIQSLNDLAWAQIHVRVLIIEWSFSIQQSLLMVFEGSNSAHRSWLTIWYFLCPWISVTKWPIKRSLTNVQCPLCSQISAHIVWRTHWSMFKQVVQTP